MPNNISPGRSWSTRQVAFVGLGSLLLGVALTSAASWFLMSRHGGSPSGGFQATEQTRWNGNELDCPGGIFCQLPIPIEQGDSNADIALELTKATLQGTKEPDLALEGRVRGLSDV